MLYATRTHKHAYSTKTLMLGLLVYVGFQKWAVLYYLECTHIQMCLVDLVYDLQVSG